MASVQVHRRHGQDVDGVRYSTMRKGEQRYPCHHAEDTRIFSRTVPTSRPLPGGDTTCLRHVVPRALVIRRPQEQAAQPETG
jgi:hypothetical protein